MADVAAPEADPKAAEAAAAAQDIAKTAPKAEAETAAEQKDTCTAPEQQDAPQVTFKVH
jgi:HD superfamily phosphohydrolase YqeK